MFKASPLAKRRTAKPETKAGHCLYRIQHGRFLDCDTTVAHAGRPWDVSRRKLEESLLEQEPSQSDGTIRLLSNRSSNLCRRARSFWSKTKLTVPWLRIPSTAFFQGVQHHHGSQLLAVVMDCWSSFSCFHPTSENSSMIQRMATAHVGADPSINADIWRRQHPSQPTSHSSFHSHLVGDLHAYVRASGIEKDGSCHAADVTSLLLVGHDRSSRNWSVYQDRSPRRVGSLASLTSSTSLTSMGQQAVAPAQDWRSGGLELPFLWDSAE